MFTKSLLLAFAALSSFSIATPGKHHGFKNILVIILENTDYASAIADSNLQSFASYGVLYTNWVAVAHPSQPNYLALTSGSTHGVADDSNVDLDVQNIADLLEAKRLTWKSYVENWPGNCFTDRNTSDLLYQREHNPFISYDNIRTNPNRCAKIVDASDLTKDIANGYIPNFAFYVPNINNDGHDTGIAFAGKWLRSFLDETGVLSIFDVVMVTTDESKSSGVNKVYTAVAGKAVQKRNKKDKTPLTHYSLLKTLELNFGLGDLGMNDTTASPFIF